MGSGKKVCVWFLANCEVQLCSTLAALSILGVVVVCPVMLDPAIDTLVSSFEDGMCQTVYNRYLTGLSNCTWTSCREGCTADIFSCWHIVVVYLQGGQEEFDAYHSRANENIMQESSVHSTSEPNSPESSNPESSISTLRSASHGAYEEGSDTNHRKKWILPPDHDFEIVDHNASYIHDIDANLKSIMSQIHQNLDIESLGGSLINVTETKMILGIGALLPNPQGCVYPSEIHCADFRALYGRVGGEVFPCYINRANRTIVVTRVDKAGAVRNIFYSLLPLIAASGIFTYLFYRVGLIGKRRRRRKATGDEESGAESDSGAKTDKNGAALPNGAPPIVTKKVVRKKFLPRKDSSKKRRKGKLFNKKNLLSIKQQLSGKSSPSTSRRTPSISMMGASVSDDGYGVMSTTNAYVNNNRNSVQLL